MLFQKRGKSIKDFKIDGLDKLDWLIIDDQFGVVNEKGSFPILKSSRLSFNQQEVHATNLSSLNP